MPVPDPLPDEAFAIRCGVPPFENPTNLVQRCRRHLQLPDLFGLSVQCAADESLDRLASWCANQKVGVLTVAEVRALGYDVLISPGLGFHATLVVPGDWDQASAEVLAQAFRRHRNRFAGEKQCMSFLLITMRPSSRAVSA